MTKLIGEQVKRHRGERQLTAAALADITEKLGHRVDTNVIANIETGRRINMPLTDLLVLAAALGVPPALLVCPVGTDQTVEITPGRPETAWDAYKEFTGDGVHVEGETITLRTADEIALYRRFDEAATDYLLTKKDDWQRAAVLESLAAVYADMRRHGLVLPTTDVTPADPRAEADKLRKQLRRQTNESGNHDRTP